MTSISTGRTLRVASYNVHRGANTAAIAKVFTHNENLAKADIILFQEIEHHQAEVICRAETIAKHLGFFFAYAPARAIRKNGTHGLALLSRFPLQEIETVKLPLYKVGLRFQQRIALIATIAADGKHLTVCNIHLDTRLNPKQRIQQLDFALDHLKTHYPGIKILGGDFNTIPFYSLGKTLPVFYINQVKRTHSHLVKQNFTTFGSPDNYTMEWAVLKWRLDHIYASGLPIVRCQAERNVFASDHKPIWADVMI